MFSIDKKPDIILASQSARRRAILANLGISFKVMVSNADEELDEGTEPSEYVEILSMRKAEAVLNELTSDYASADPLIIASDTVVVCDGKILGKPKDKEDAARMIGMLSGRKHSVISGIAVIYREEAAVSHEVTEVEFRELTEDEILAYISTDEPYDKAGGYGIQDKASVFVRGIHGDYHNVVGLPVFKLFRLLDERFGIGFFQLTSED
ncbi:MAG: septum formation protein Maf [Clostridia bacterium]|nr:septum formation protein Maf [Clostridia bacterium]